MPHSHGIGYARKAMIRCGLSLDVRGQWHVPQLSLELQQIVGKHLAHFDGEAVAPYRARIASEDMNKHRILLGHGYTLFRCGFK
jgi:hypothetical protein